MKKEEERKKERKKEREERKKEREERKKERKKESKERKKEREERKRRKKERKKEREERKNSKRGLTLTAQTNKMTKKRVNNSGVRGGAFRTGVQDCQNSPKKRIGPIFSDTDF